MLRPDILNMIEEKVKSTLILIGTGKDLLKRITIERALRKKIGAHKLKSFCISEATIIGTKLQVI